MRNYGTLRLDRSENEWDVSVEPHVAMMAKRVFGKIPRIGNSFRLKHTPQNCFEIAWFCQRYPLECPDLSELLGSSERHQERIQRLDQIIDPNYKPTQHELAVPARQYQLLAADMWLNTEGLLLADVVGLGKTASAIAAMASGRITPTLVVTLANLPTQWAREINRFAPDLHVHILKTMKPYELPKMFGRGPDVIVCSYHKLSSWCDILKEYCKSVVFDEVQELRHPTSNKYDAAQRITSALTYRIGLSVGPESTVILRGGPFGPGWVGDIAEAWRVIAATTERQLEGGYEILRVNHRMIESRGWNGNNFCWKSVKTFIRHPCDRPVATVFAGGVRTLMTVDHSVFVATDAGIVSKRSDALRVGEVIPMDDGACWSDGAVESPLSILPIARQIPRAQVVVSLDGTTRHELGLNAWEWQNCLREAKYGSRLPIEVYLRSKNALPDPTLVYIGRGKGAALPPQLLLSRLAYLLGFFLGDGWVSCRQRVCFAVENARVQEFVRFIDSLNLGLRPTIRQMQGQSSEVRISNRLLAEVFISVMGVKKCFDKAIPGEWIATWPEDARRELVRGMIDSDGHVSVRDRGRRRCYYCTTSRQLADSLMCLLRSLGVSPGVHVRAPAKGGKIKERVIRGSRPTHQVNWSMHDFYGTHTSNFCGKRRKLQIHNRFTEGCVRSVTRDVAPDFVYDIEMDGHPSFTANGMMVHNSATPIYNFGGEMFNVMEQLCPGRLGSREEFEREWCVDGSLSDPDAFGSFLREQHMMLRRTKEDVGRELPVMQKITYPIDADAKALEAIKGRAGELARLLLSGEAAPRGTAMQAAAEFDVVMRQATGIAKAPHVAAFVEMLLEQDIPVVLYGWHHAVYDIWMEQLSRFKPELYSGRQSPSQKQQAVDRFVGGETNLLILSLRAGAGLDGLQKRCSTTVHGELDWSPGIIEQDIGRVFRDGQTAPVVSYILLSDSGTDPLMAETLGLKTDQIDGILGNRQEMLQRVESGNTLKKLAQQYLSHTKA